VLDELDDPRTLRVCLLAGSLSSDVLAERDLQRCVLAEMTEFGGHFSALLEAARANGELPEGFQVEITAQVIVTYLQGMFRVIRVLHDRAHIERQIEALLAGLGLSYLSACFSKAPYVVSISNRFLEGLRFAETTG
jgi:TetR/AcrR family transcriptional regulator, transcriptional repressor for nem operon